MESDFLKKTAPYIIGGTLAVVGVVAYLSRPKPLPPPPDRDCFSLTGANWDKVFVSGWSDPLDPNYTQSLVFSVDKSVEPAVIKITPYRYDTDKAECVPSEQGSVTLPSSADCSVGSWTSSMGVYDILPTDVAGGTFKFGTINIVPREDPVKPGTLQFELDFYGDGTHSKTVIGLPCPPYCPKPIEAVKEE